MRIMESLAQCIIRASLMFLTYKTIFLILGSCKSKFLSIIQMTLWSTYDDPFSCTESYP